MPLFTEILEICANSPLSEGYQYRTPDYKKPKSGKTLFKEMHRFYKNKQNWDGGTSGGMGEYFKKKKTHDAHSNYFLAIRTSVREYFIYEVLNVIGLQVPKTRLILENGNFYVATSSFAGYEPIDTFLNIDKDEPDFNASYTYDGLKRNFSYKSIYDTKAKYFFRTQSHMLFDTKTKETLPIRGCLPASNIIADFLQDPDGIDGIGGSNSGLIKKKHSYEFAIIDKESAAWDPNPPENEKIDFCYDKTPLAFWTNDDQKSAILYQMANLFVVRNGERTIDKIYFNPRSSSALKENTIIMAAFSPLISIFKDDVKYRMNDDQIKTLSTRLRTAAIKAANEFPDAEINIHNIEKFSKHLSKAVLHEAELLNQEKLFNDDFLKDFQQGQEKNFWLVNCLLEIDAMKDRIAYLFEKNNITVDKFKQFITRETLREKLCAKVNAHFSFPDDHSSRLMIRNICEDLRGTRFCEYYHDPKSKLISENDLNNDALFKALCDAVAKEFSAAPKASAECSTKPTIS